MFTSDCDEGKTKSDISKVDNKVAGTGEDDTSLVLAPELCLFSNLKYSRILKPNFTCSSLQKQTAAKIFNHDRPFIAEREK